MAIGEQVAWGFRAPDLVVAAAKGSLRSWADRLVVGQTAWSGGEMPSRFWTLLEGKLGDWHYGKFEIDVEGRFTVRAEGVKFYAQDLRALFPYAFKRPRKSSVAAKRTTPKLAASAKAAKVPANAPAPEVAKPAATGGRKPSQAWPDWVAELVAYVHEEGFPEGEGTAGVDVMQKAVADRLSERGLDSPARSTTQETMRAVLRRLRG